MLRRHAVMAFSGLCVLLAAFAPVARAGLLTDKGEGNEDYKRAINEIKTEDIAAAALFLRRAREKCPDSAAILVACAEVAKQTDKPKEAVAPCKKVLAQAMARRKLMGAVRKSVTVTGETKKALARWDSRVAKAQEILKEVAPGEEAIYRHISELLAESEEMRPDQRALAAKFAEAMAEAFFREGGDAAENDTEAESRRPAGAVWEKGPDQVQFKKVPSDPKHWITDYGTRHPGAGATWEAAKGPAGCKLGDEGITLSNPTHDVMEWRHAMPISQHTVFAAHFRLLATGECELGLQNKDSAGTVSTSMMMVVPPRAWCTVIIGREKPLGDVVFYLNDQATEVRGKASMTDRLTLRFQRGDAVYIKDLQLGVAKKDWLRDAAGRRNRVTE